MPLTSVVTVVVLVDPMLTLPLPAWIAEPLTSVTAEELTTDVAIAAATGAAEADPDRHVGVDGGVGIDRDVSAGPVEALIEDPSTVTFALGSMSAIDAAAPQER